MPDTTLIFTIVAAIIIIGFIAEQSFRRTGVPSFVFLIIIGIVLGPVTHVLDASSLFSSLEVFAVLTLLMVLFYGGMDMKVDAVMRGGSRAIAQAMIYVLASTILIGYILNHLLGWDLLQSLIFASMIGGETTAAVMVPLSKSMKLPEVTVAFLTLESAMNSILSAILFFAFLGAYQTGHGNIFGTVSTLASSFSVGVVMGAALSFAWLNLLERIQGYKYTYVLTLGLLFLTYAASAYVGGSGILSAVVFGAMLGNHRLLGFLKGRPFNMESLTRQLTTFQDEISFLMATLFFVALGLTLRLDLPHIAYNLLISLLVLSVLLSCRVVALHVSTYASVMQKDRYLLTVLCAQGLTPATLAIIAVNSGLPLGDTFLSLVTYIIILTNLVTALGAMWNLRKQKYSFREFMQELEKETGIAGITS